MVLYTSFCPFILYTFCIHFILYTFCIHFILYTFCIHFVYILFCIHFVYILFCIHFVYILFCIHFVYILFCIHFVYILYTNNIIIFFNLSSEKMQKRIDPNKAYRRFKLKEKSLKREELYYISHGVGIYTTESITTEVLNYIINITEALPYILTLSKITIDVAGDVVYYHGTNQKILYIGTFHNLASDEYRERLIRELIERTKPPGISLSFE